MIEFFDSNNIQYDEDFDQILYIIKKPKSVLLYDFEIWKGFNKKNKIDRINIIFTLEDKVSKNQYELKITDSLDIYHKRDDDFNNKVATFKHLVNEIDRINKKDFSSYCEVLKNEIIESSTLNIINITISIRKEAINDYLCDQINLQNEIYFSFWSKLEKIDYYFKSNNLLTLSKNLVEKNQYKIIVVPGIKDVVFSNFFEITALDSINNIKSNLDQYMIKIKSLDELLENYENETEFTESTPNFPFLFSFINKKEIESKIWESMYSIIIYTILTILSDKVERFEKNNKEYFNFYYGHNQQQTYRIFNKETNVILEDPNVKKHNEKIIEKSYILKILVNFSESRFFDSIGDFEEKRIRESSILRVLTPQLKDLSDLLINSENIISAQTRLRKDLIRGKIADLNETYKQMDSILRKSTNDISTATTKLTGEISKSFMTLVGTTLIALFGYFTDFSEAKFEIPDWVFLILPPVVGLVFLVFFLLQIISILFGVISQKRIYDQSESELKLEVGVKVNKKIKQNLKRNLKVFYVYFSLSLFLSLAIISLIIFAMVKIN